MVSIVVQICYCELTIVCRHHNAFFVFGDPGIHVPKNATELIQYNNRKAIHRKYLAHYKELMAQLSKEDAEKFGTWG